MLKSGPSYNSISIKMSLLSSQEGERPPWRFPYTSDLGLKETEGAWEQGRALCPLCKRMQGTGQAPEP